MTLNQFKESKKYGFFAAIIGLILTVALNWLIIPISLDKTNYLNPIINRWVNVWFLAFCITMYLAYKRSKYLGIGKLFTKFGGPLFPFYICTAPFMEAANRRVLAKKQAAKNARLQLDT